MNNFRERDARNDSKNTDQIGDAKQTAGISDLKQSNEFSYNDNNEEAVANRKATNNVPTTQNDQKPFQHANLPPRPPKISEL